MEQKKKRFDEIDIAKGIGIIFVVLAHSLKQIDVDSDQIFYSYKLIYHFIMPVFFILSGYTSLKILDLHPRQGGMLTYIKGRVERLLIPYFFMSLLYLPLKMLMNPYARRPYELSSAWKIFFGSSPDTTMWFLYTLFWCTVLGALILNHRNLYYIAIASFVLSGVTFYLDLPYKLPFYFFFFVLGLIIRINYDRILPWFSFKVAIPALLLFIAVQIVKLQTGVDCIFPFTQIIGPYLVWYLSIRINDADGSLKKVFLYLGNKSMDIYVISDPVMICLRLVFRNILSLPLAVCIAIFFVGSTLISLPISSLIVRRVRILKLLILGMRS